MVSLRLGVIPACFISEPINCNNINIDRKKDSILRIHKKWNMVHYYYKVGIVYPAEREAI